MVTTLSIAEAREQFTRLPERFDEEPDLTVQITRHGKPVMVVLPWDTYESIIETMEVMADPDLMAALRQSANDIAQGKTSDLATVKARLGFSA
ncbi:MAG: type II toxin-antitoxin system Phd/YefM family antitoxin [Thermomicrobiales bacterium]